MKYPKLRELKEAVIALIKGPYTTKFPFKPHTPFPKFRGKPTPDEKECIGCGACAEVCPARAIEVKDTVADGRATRSLIWHYDLCIYCAQCERLCTTEKGVKLTNEYDLVTFDRKTSFSEITKELVLCENCGEIIAPKDQILWVAKKLGPMTYGNLLVFGTLQKHLHVSTEYTQPETDLPAKRSDMFRLSCPKCRHQIFE
ncbi:MAG: hypothetical protein AUJ85_03525 [Elusimicrobia bacterium CG1_02_37_114]|nr:MAG: hypothetical protein AUJ85_03525 [Elusimicrobia bacterium CG1_02_37_114]PIV52803.1 MAG: 4Fe-4S ferredoxin [Elusimicrobia bacterium CG02_land_8_20_14_3_00_37_13]PIZ13387.1 MAG: 4Fe-4S ferredoxin [Elusimicrobia bacterium CG_4_10_14_0_8_um_filter_37_32]